MIKDRQIALEGAYNMRDMGGVRTADGREVLGSKLFRADGLHKLTEADLALLSDVGIASVVDLRSQGEIDRIGIARLTDHGAQHIHVPLHIGDPAITGQMVPRPDNLGESYLAMAAVGAERFVAAIEALALPGNTPAVFHCSAGKDRTGMIAALIYSILEVDREDIVHDYAMTEANMERMLPELMLAFPELMKNAKEERANMDRAFDEAIRTFLAGLDAQYGSPVAWLQQNGLRQSTIDSLRSELLG